VKTHIQTAFLALALFVKDKHGAVDKIAAIWTILILLVTFFIWYWLSTATAATGAVDTFIEFLVIGTGVTVFFFWFMSRHKRA
jgi:hypothetical protein